MKIYCFIKNNKIAVYDRANWKEQGQGVKRIALVSLLGEAGTQEFIKYVQTKHEPIYNSLLDLHPDTYMYEIDL